MKKSSLSFLFAISWLFITTFLLILPGTKFPVENWFDKIWMDKWVHVFLFAVMVFLWCKATASLKNEKQTQINLFILLAFIWFFYGIGMEFVQKHLVSFRSFDVGDIIADGVGCLVGLVYSIRKYTKK